jgi:hypothetical protein
MGPIDLAQKALAAGLQVDGITIHAYPRASEGPVFFRDLIQRARLTLDKPVLIQETGYPSQGCPSCGDQWAAWEGVFDEATQAAWIKYMTAIPFGTEDTMGVLYYSAEDAAYASSPSPPTDSYGHMGLFALDRTKLAYNVYLQQIRTFTTLGSNLTDSQGTISFRGFAGDYVISFATSSGGKVETRIHVEQLSNSTCSGQQDSTITLTDLPWQPLVTNSQKEFCATPTVSTSATSTAQSTFVSTSITPSTLSTVNGISNDLLIPVVLVAAIVLVVIGAAVWRRSKNTSAR